MSLHAPITALVAALAASCGSDAEVVEVDPDRADAAVEVDHGEVSVDTDDTDTALGADDTDAAFDVGGSETLPDPTLAACRGPTIPIVLAGDTPLAEVSIGTTHGYFLLDWGTTASAIDPSGFSPRPPQPVAGTTNRWDGFSFFGPWATVTLLVQDFSAFDEPVRQAGILGTDFLALDPFLVDWEARVLARAEAGRGCDDDTLRAAGYLSLSSDGYFARHLGDLLPNVPNVPTVPVRIGRAEAPAQIDTGFDDRLAGPAINVNRAFAERIALSDRRRAGELDLVLTTCVPGVVEPVEAWRLADGVAVELVAEDGRAARAYPDAIIFVKQTPSAASVCGGIGTWTTPAAQLGASFMARAGRVVFDPLRSRVWLSAE